MSKLQQFKPVMLALLATGAISASVPALAGERESLEQLRNTTLTLIDMLVKEGVLSKTNADNLVKQAQEVKQPVSGINETGTTAEAAASGAGKTENVVRVQYVPEFVKNQLRDEIKKEVMAKLNYKAGERLGLPDWLDRITFDGDLRLRYEMDSFPSNGNTPPGTFSRIENRNTIIDNTSEDRQRFRVRARLGANIKFADWLSGGIRMTTGKVDDPVSPNQTLESTDSKFSFALDRAYLKAQPYSWLSASGGRFANPFFSTDLVWDPDLAFDGVATTVKPKFDNGWSLFGTVGAFPIDEVNTSDTNKARDKWLYGGQVGVEWKSPNDSIVKFGVALYDFKNVEGGLNPLGQTTLNGTAPAFRQKGNSTFSIDRINNNDCGNGGPCGLASEFRELNFTGQVDLATFDPVHVILTGDYARNLGFDEKDIARRTGLPVGTYKKETDAYQVRLSVGMRDTLKRNDWQVFGAYKRLEADSVLDAFTDSDFHLGGTDAKGWILGGSYGLDKNVWTQLRWFSSDAISGPPLSIDVLLLDLNAKF